jgi:4-amino-4-deoxy-L-arabinose transferase-like glycosyltransferase
MPTAETLPARAGQQSPIRTRAWAGTALCGVLVAALGLRLWGVAGGLPYIYDVDEAAHFVPRAVAMRGWELNPHYFANPPALTYLLHGLFELWFGGYAGVVRAAALNPGEEYLIARVAVAILGTIAVWLLYVLATRLFDRRVALLAAALEAVAFLPAFYAHLALNDVPALVPVTVALIGSAGVMRSGHLRDYALAGLGIGLGAATKYTAGIVVVALLGAVAVSLFDGRSWRWRPALVGLSMSGAVALVAFLIANPYALLDFHAFTHELAHESAVAEEAGGKLGAPHGNGIVYYLWSITWGLGWVPALAALGGGLLAWVKRRRVAVLLTPMIVVYLVVMGSAERQFGRWLMPLVPALCVLAAYLALASCSALAGLPPGTGASRSRQGAARWRVLSAATAVLAAAALLAQGAVHTVHADEVLSRPDTLTLARAWMVAHIPKGARIVVEPVVPQAWLHQADGLGPPATVAAERPRAKRARWEEYEWLLKRIVPASANGAGSDEGIGPGWRVAHRYSRVEDYEYTLSPSLIDFYIQQRYCWIMTASQQAGRAFSDPRQAPGAIAYYRALASGARAVYHLSPYAPGSRPVAFNFDWSYDDYPLAYRLAGPEITVYRLRGGRCGAPA